MSNNTSGSHAHVNGLDVYYEVHGTGKPLVLLHGAFGTAEGWMPLLPTLTKTRQVILIEQQGHGHTAGRDSPLSYQQMVEDTAALLKHLKLPPADVFGYSMGGTVALGIAARYPEFIDKIAILGACSRKISDVYEAESYRQFQSIPADFAPPVLKTHYDQVAPDPTHWPILVAKIKALGNDFQGYADDEVKAIKAPVLIMQGDHDGVRPEHAVELYRMIANAQLAVFPNEDHFILWTNPDKVLAILLPFLDAPLQEDGGDIR